MQTVFEIFDPATAKTEAHMDATARDRYLRRMDAAGYVRDYMPAAREGFYVVNGGGRATGPFDRATAERKAEMENMASDAQTFTVLEHRL